MLTFYKPIPYDREADIARQKQEEDAARERIGLVEGATVADFTLRGKRLTECYVSRLGEFIVELQVTRCRRRTSYQASAVFLEKLLAKEGTI